MNLALWTVAGLLAIVLLVSSAQIIIPREKMATIGGNSASWVMDFSPGALRATRVSLMLSLASIGSGFPKVACIPRGREGDWRLRWAGTFRARILQIRPLADGFTAGYCLDTDFVAESEDGGATYDWARTSRVGEPQKG